MRRIKRAKITFISLCPRGVNEMPVLFKEDGTMVLEALVKGDASEGELTALVYVPERPDKEGDRAEASVIKEMAHDYLRDGGKLDLRHDGKPLTPDQAYIAENFIVQKGDPRFQDMKDYTGKVVDATGAWGMVIKIDDPKLRKLYKDGEWNGVSMFGTAEVEQSKEDVGVLQKIWDAIRGIAPTNQEEPDDMDEKLRKELDALKEGISGLTGAVKGLVEARKADDEAVAKAALDAETKLTKETVEKLKTAEAKLAKLEKSDEEKEADAAKVMKSAKDELKAAEAKIADLEKASNQTTKSDEGDETVSEGVSKEDMDLFKLGEAMAKAMNGETQE